MGNAMTDPRRLDDYATGHPDDVRAHMNRRLAYPWLREAKAALWRRVLGWIAARVRR